MPDETTVHGCVSTYKAGCRCKPCKEAKATHLAKVKRRNWIAAGNWPGPGRLPNRRTHGVSSTYKSGCRCERCAEAMRTKRRERYERRAAEQGVAPRPRRIEQAHGTSGYKRGCRCDVCRQAKTAAMRRYWAATPERAAKRRSLAKARKKTPQPPKSGGAPGHHPRGLAHNLASITSRIIVAQTGRDANQRAASRRRARLRGVQRVEYNPSEIFERDGWRCQLCGKRVDPKFRYPDRRSASIDHVLPLAAGGDDVPWNVQLAHLGCNSAKGTGGDQLRLAI